jgi:hypothetical protein
MKTMPIHDSVIAKLHQLPEPLVQEVNDFIDFITQKYQSQPTDSPPETRLEKKWSKWFSAVDALEVIPPQPANTYSELLLSKYRQQGLDL